MLARIGVAVVAALTLGACSSSPKAADSVAAASETAANQESATEPVAVAPSTDPVAPDTVAPTPSPDDVLTTAEETGKYPTFIKLVNEAELTETLKTGGPYTIAIPTEEAFAALPKETLAALLADKTELARVLKYHVVPGIIAPDPAASGPAPTLEGSTLELVFTATDTKVNGAAVLTAPRATANGAFIAIDKVLVPPAKISALQNQSNRRDGDAGLATRCGSGDSFFLSGFARRPDVSGRAGR
jgi:uncharacterized surface protein with fasciclin (FAS1) repeats